MFIHRRRMLSAFSVVCVLAGSLPAEAQEAVPSSVSTFGAEYFSRSNPSTALDMIGLLPGFQLREGDSDVRGLSGASGNVLIDGGFPTSKQEKLETILKRIPAARVMRIETIRSAAAGIDMRGNSVIANVILDRRSAMQGRIEAEYSSFAQGLDAPRLEGQFLYGGESRTVDVSAAIYRETDDEHGFGSRARFYPVKDENEVAAYAQPEGADIQRLALKYEHALTNGTMTFTGLGQQKKKFAEILERPSAPETSGEIGLERGNTVSTEFSLGYLRPLGADRQIDVSLFQNNSESRDRDQSLDDGDLSINRERSNTSETILKAAYRLSGSAVSFETGLEASRNILDSEASLEENGFDIELPASEVRVEENRAEAYVSATWAASERLSIEGTGRFEASKLMQSGESALTKSLMFFKPRLAVNYKQSDKIRLNFLVEREVGQLDFGDFVSSPSVSTGDVTAGNVDLEPETLWRYEASVERSVGTGAVRLTVRHEDVSDVVDHIPIFAVSETYDAIGNLDKGTRDEVEFNLSVPLDMVGIPGANFQADAIWRKSEVDAEGALGSRPISEIVPREIQFKLNKFVPSWQTRFGVQLTLSEEETTYKVDEVKTDRIGERFEVFAEFTPTDQWTIRTFAKNLTDTPATRTREKYAGLRGQSPRVLVEKRSLESGQYFGIRVARSFD